MLKKLKKKYDIKSNIQLVIILLVFSLSGSASLLVRKAVFDWFGIHSDTSLWLKIPLYIMVIFPAYQILFLTIGTLFGQFRFTWEFKKKLFTRLSFKK